MNDLGDAVAKLPGVAEIALATPNQTADTGIVQVIPTTAPDAPRPPTSCASCAPTTTSGSRSSAST
jgi:hypothetical protein